MKKKRKGRISEAVQTPPMPFERLRGPLRPSWQDEAEDRKKRRGRKKRRKRKKRKTTKKEEEEQVTCA